MQRRKSSSVKRSSCHLCEERKIACKFRKGEAECTDCQKSGMECKTIEPQPQQPSMLSTKPLKKPAFLANDQELPDFTTRDMQKSFTNLNAIKLNPKVVLRCQFNSTKKKQFVTDTGITYNERSKTVNAFLDDTRSVVGSVIQDYFDNLITSGKQISNYKLDESDVEVLHIYGCFSLPSTDSCWEYINMYFKKFHVLNPIIDKQKFMKDYANLKDPPSLLLLQCIISTGYRDIAQDDWTIQQKLQHKEMTRILFRRARALYDAGVEDDPIPLIQSLVLLSQYLAQPNSSGRDVVHWLKVAVVAAKKFYMDRNQENSKVLDQEEIKMYKRLWWFLFTKDRIVSFVYNISFAFNLNVCDVPILDETDFADDEDPLAGRFFVQLAKICQLMEVLIQQQNIINLFIHKKFPCYSIIKKSDALLAKWMDNLPDDLQLMIMKPETHLPQMFLLNIFYYMNLLVIHRSNLMKRIPLPGSVTSPKNDHQESIVFKAVEKYEDGTYPSWVVTFQCAYMIVFIVKRAKETDQMDHLTMNHILPVFFAGMIMLSHLSNKNPNVSKIAKECVMVALDVLEYGIVKWPTAATVLYIIQSIYNDTNKQAILTRKMLDTAKLTLHEETDIPEFETSPDFPRNTVLKGVTFANLSDANWNNVGNVNRQTNTKNDYSGVPASSHQQQQHQQHRGSIEESNIQDPSLLDQFISPAPITMFSDLNAMNGVTTHFLASKPGGGMVANDLNDPLQQQPEHPHAMPHQQQQQHHQQNSLMHYLHPRNLQSDTLFAADKLDGPSPSTDYYAQDISIHENEEGDASHDLDHSSIAQDHLKNWL